MPVSYTGFAPVTRYIYTLSWAVIPSWRGPAQASSGGVWLQWWEELAILTMTLSKTIGRHSGRLASCVPTAT